MSTLQERLRTSRGGTLWAACAEAADRLDELEREVEALRADAERECMRRALHDIAEEWAGAECGEPVYAQEAYAIELAKRMYALAVKGLLYTAPPAESERIAALEAALEQARVALRDARASLHGHGYNAGIIAKVDVVLRAIEETRGC